MLATGLTLLSWFNKLRLGEYPIAVLYFHRVLAQPNAFAPDDFTAEQFDDLLCTLTQHFHVLPLSKALEQKFSQTHQNIKSKKLTLCLTFDDGYLDNFTTALPILDKYNAKASFFIATDGTTRGYLWNDELAFLLEHTPQTSISLFDQTYDLSNLDYKAQSYLRLVSELKFMDNRVRDAKLAEIRRHLNIETKIPRCMMSAKQLNELQQQGHDIGAHTKSHSILAVQPDDVAFNEIKHSKQFLDQHLAKPVSLFAYPNGWLGRDFNERHQNMVDECGFKYGVATNDGGIIKRSNPMALPRFMPYRKQLTQFCLAVAKIAGETHGTES